MQSLPFVPLVEIQPAPKIMKFRGEISKVLVCALIDELCQGLNHQTEIMQPLHEKNHNLFSKPRTLPPKREIDHKFTSNQT